MRLDVQFQGLCLFVPPTAAAQRQDHARVLLPHAWVKRAMKDNKLDADSHYAYLVLAKANIDQIVALKGCTVDFLALPTTNTNIGTTLRENQSFIDIASIATNLKLDKKDDPQSVAATVKLKGGSVTIKELTLNDREWVIESTLKNPGGPPIVTDRVATQATWTIESDEIAIRVTPHIGQVITIPLTADAKVIIGNRCIPLPWPDEDTEECQDGEDCADLDFKWYFEVLESKSGDNIKKRLNGKQLPHPVCKAKALAGGGGGNTVNAILGASTPTCLIAKLPQDDE